MRSNIGLELPTATDPQLNWKMTAKGRQWAVRRTRTSVAGGNKKNSVVNSSKRSEDTMDKDPKRAREISVSESEKVGVSILGRHFCDSLVIVPIKKRRFLSVSSPSSPLQSSYSDDSDHLLESQPASYQESLAYDKICDKRIVAGKMTSLDDINEEASDAADFSGISILAAAACSSEILSDTINAGGLGSKEHCCKEAILEYAQGAELHSLYEDKERQPQSIQDLQENCNVPMEKCSSFILADDEKLQGSENEKSFMDSLQNASDKMRSSTCDSRLHWDLNTVMDTWNNNYDEAVISKPLPTDHVCENHNHSEKLEDFVTFQHRVENGESTCPVELGISLENVAGSSKDNLAIPESEVQEKPDVCNDNSVADHEKAKQCCFLPHSDGLIENNLDDTSVSLVNPTEETKIVYNQGDGIGSAEDVSSVVGDILGSLRDATLVIKSVDKARADVDSDLVLETETSVSYLPFSGDTSSDFNAHACNSHLKLVQSISEPMSDEKPNVVASVAVNSSDDHCLVNAEVEHPTHMSSSQIEKHAFLNTDSESGDKCPVHAEKAFDVFFDGNVYINLMETCGKSGKSVHSDDIDITTVVNTDGSSRALDMSPCLLNSQQQGSSESCNPDELSSGVTCVVKHEQATAELKIDDDKCISSVVPTLVSAGMTVADIDVNLVGSAVGTQEAGKSYMDSCINNSGEVAFNDHIRNYDSDASHVDAVLSNGMEKADLLGDDDSQFEDGEFRESVLQSWGEDGAEEGESEHVDYGSDSRENVVFEEVSGFPDSVSFAVENVTCKSRDAPVVHDGANTVVNDLFAVSQPPLKISSKSASSDAGHGKRIFIGDGRKDCTDHLAVNDGSRTQRNGSDASVPHSCSENMIEYSGFRGESDYGREPSATVRMKLSGWDQLPVALMRTGDNTVDAEIGSVKQDGTAGALDVFDADESLGRSGSSLRRGLSSRVERLMSSDESHRRERSYIRGSRSNDHGGRTKKTERNTGAPKSAGRDGSSRHAQWRGREEHWFDSTNHHGPRHHDSPGYCDAPSYSRPGSRNAAAAAVAKVESNGFVVASDGTIVRAGGAGNAGHVLRRSASAMLKNKWGSQAETNHACGMQRRLGNLRDTTPDKHFNVGRSQAGKYDREMVRDRYRRPVPDDSMDLSIHRLSRRERDRSLSPHRGPHHLSRSSTRSHSRSRTQSPHLWTSPRRRSEIGMNDVPVFRRRSRSPKARMERMRSPHPRSSFEDHMVGYGPTLRTLASPLHSSRWVDERRDSPNHFREHEYKQCSRRSPTIRVFRNHRLDSVDSQGRSKPDVYYRPLHSSKIPEVAGLSRGYRCAGSDDRRGYGDRYESLRPMRQYNIDGNEKRFS